LHANRTRGLIWQGAKRALPHSEFCHLQCFPG